MPVMFDAVRKSFTRSGSVLTFCKAVWSKANAVPTIAAPGRSHRRSLFSRRIGLVRIPRWSLAISRKQRPGDNIVQGACVAVCGRGEEGTFPCEALDDDSCGGSN